MANFDDEKTKPYRPAPGGKGGVSASADPDKTRAWQGGGYYDDEDDDDDGDVTRAAVPGRAAADGSKPRAGRISIEAASGRKGPSIVFPEDTASQPVCAVMLVVRGPGQGICVPISYGRSSVGRDKQARVQLNIGDDQLSGLHFIVAFDDADGSFDVREADAATNHTYVNGARIRGATVLKAGDVIKAGADPVRRHGRGGRRR
ncbi:MAG TPA: FHA domain-containing protein, partial [Caulobacteraceae bacterium]|nr:FHA domain-containing protein [Caulobacteraceae bacterium]